MDKDDLSGMVEATTSRFTIVCDNCKSKNCSICIDDTYLEDTIYIVCNDCKTVGKIEW